MASFQVQMSADEAAAYERFRLDCVQILDRDNGKGWCNNQRQARLKQLCYMRWTKLSKTEKLEYYGTVEQGKPKSTDTAAAAAAADTRKDAVADDPEVPVPDEDSYMLDAEQAATEFIARLTTKLTLGPTAVAPKTRKVTKSKSKSKLPEKDEKMVAPEYVELEKKFGGRLKAAPKAKPTAAAVDKKEEEKSNEPVSAPAPAEEGPNDKEKAPPSAMNATFTKEDVSDPPPTDMEPVLEEVEKPKAAGGRKAVKKTPSSSEANVTDDDGDKDKPVRGGGRAKKEVPDLSPQEQAHQNQGGAEVKAEAAKKQLKKTRSKRDITAEVENKEEQLDGDKAAAKKPSRSRTKKDAAVVNDIPEETGAAGGDAAESANKDGMKDDAPAAAKTRKPRAKKAAAVDDNKENADGNKKQADDGVSAAAATAAAPKGRGRKK